MPLVADRVAETTTTTGTGTVTLAGAKTGYQAFTTAFSTGAKVYYCITDNTDWEVGIGTFTTVGTTLSRDSIFASSNAGAAVNWGAGTRDVFCTAPMQSIVGAPRLQDKTGAYTVVASDNGSIINCTSGTFTVSLTAAATLGSGFTCWIWNTSSTYTHEITIDANAAESIDGQSTLILRRGEGTQIVCDGTNWQTGDKKAMRGYSENITASTVRAAATGNISLALGSSSLASGSNSLCFGQGVASGTGSLVVASTWNVVTASSSYSTAIGLNSAGNGSQAVTGAGAMALGGSYASGNNSFAAAVGNNTSSYGATAANAVAIGSLAKATGVHSVAIGGNGGTIASGAGAVALGGTNQLNNGVATASGIGSFACGDSTVASATAAIAIGYGVEASGYGSVAIGTDAVATIRGKFAYAATGFSSFRTGQCQYGMVILARQTADATATVLTVNNTTATTTNQVILPNNSAYAFTGTVVARRQAAGGTESAAWKIEGLIRREGTAASTTLVASTVTAISNAPGWTLALSADTTNGGLAVTATGAASTNIRWVATVQTSEVTYA